jgi:hypothetical protein
MAVTLVDYMKTVTTNPLKKGFIADLLRYSDLLKIVPVSRKKVSRSTDSVGKLCLVVGSVKSVVATLKARARPNR